MVVHNRKRETLRPIIEQYVLPGTPENPCRVITDCHKSYDYLGNVPGIVHEKVNHSQNFVDPVTGACSNSIEGNGMA